MRVLVTGGSGFIGSHVVDKLRARGHEPVIYDLRPSPWHEPGSVDTVLGSITDREALERALHSCDAVAHLAAVADVNDVHAEPEDAERVNARGTVAVLEACRRAGVKRVLYASTIWVYSDTESDVVDEDTLLPPPSHLYTSTKLAGELYCKSYQELYGIDYTILRFGIPYGPRAREAAVIPAFVNKAFRGEPLTLSGDGMQSRRFVYVEDLADGVALGLADVAVNRVYNLVSDENVTIKQIAELVQETIGNTEIVYTPARPGDLGTKIVSGDRARDELGWTAATPFADGVRKYIDWRRDQDRRRKDDEDAAIIPAGEPDAEAKPRQILIISADIGEGHDLPARAVAREFRDEDPDANISIVNGLPAMGPFLTRLLRENSWFMFTFVPWWFHFQYRLFMDVRPTRWLARQLLWFFGHRGLRRLIRAHDPDLIVSTYPGTTALLGEMRRRGRLKVPCYSSITDLAGLQFWAHPGIDMHFITHPESAEEVERIAGPGSVRWAKPPTSPAFLAARSRADARRALGLPATGQVIAVSGGGWGVGDLAGATRAALQIPDAIVLCLCGRNDRLRAKVVGEFGHEPRLRVMGFTDRMGDVLAAADALVHSSAGLTVLEAIIRGCPVISYGFSYGHVRAADVAMERFGLAQVARQESQLVPMITRALEHRPEPDGRFARRPSTASLILGNERRARSLPAWRLRAVRSAVAVGAAVLVAGWTLTTGASYSLVSHIAHIRPVTAVSTDRPEVGVLINAPAGQVPELASVLSTYGIHASFAVAQPSSPVITTVSSYHDQALPRLPNGGLVRWLGARAQLHRLLTELGSRHTFLYASSGPSLGQWLMAHGAGGRLVAGAISLQDADDPVGFLRPGEVVQFSVTNAG
ncbi:MAG TPA: NAD-dependent epimerase/dehydratase family protein, partial [Solirubrobacteraceae bacterium]|nr:NAD-dependent epimerase/dehydratase family protein [Solirubrobacteraceae bacterium]